MGFGSESEELRRLLNRMLKDALQGRVGVFREPFVYGFTSRSPDGRIETVRQVQATDGQELVSRNPVSDVIVSDDAVSVTADLSAVSQGDLDVRMEGRKLVIEADGVRRYFAVIDLPADIDGSTLTSTFRNGVLDITVKRSGCGTDP